MAVSYATVILRGTCPGGSCPGWRLSVKRLYEDSYPDGSCPGWNMS